MVIKNIFIAGSTAAAIALSSIALPATASAMPFAAASPGAQVALPGVETVGQRRRHGRRVHRRRHYRGNYYNPGAAAAAGIIGLAAGAIIAGSAANAGPVCRVRRVRVWSPRLGAYVIQRQRVC